MAKRDVSPHISSPTYVSLGMDGLILGIEPRSFDWGTLPLPARQVGSPPTLVYLMALIGTKQSSLLWPADELL